MKIKLLFLFLIFINISFAQEIQTKFITKTALNADQFIGTDDLGNLYYLKNNILFKKNNKEILSYSNFNLGALTSVNIQNPFKIILFYKHFNSVIILDNKLNELTNKIDFTKETQFNNVQFISTSSENNLWLLADDNKLHLYDYKEHSQKFETKALNYYQKDINVLNIKSSYKFVWVLTNKGILQFNEYGSFLQLYLIENINKIFPYKDGFILYKNKTLQYLKNNKTIQINENYKLSIKNISIDKSSIYIYDGEFIYQYDIL